jgi:hypothetical protein
MKSDRKLMELAKTKTLEALAEHLNRSPAAVLRKNCPIWGFVKRVVKGK